MNIDQRVYGYAQAERQLSELRRNQQPAPCEWRPDDDGTFHTACGHAFQFMDGSPRENGQRFCGYCGGQLIETKNKRR
jgi:hypothetical protein